LGALSDQAQNAGEIKVSHGFQMEKAKLLHLCGKVSEAQEVVMELIKADPANELYWIMMYLLRGKSEKNSAQEQRAVKFMFKAYEINPSNHLVLSCLIGHYHQQE
jgi:hypothetical protein